MRPMYQVWPSALNSVQIHRIRELGEGKQCGDGTIFSPLETMEKTRSCTIQWIDDLWLKNLKNIMITYGL